MNYALFQPLNSLVFLYFLGISERERKQERESKREKNRLERDNDKKSMREQNELKC